MFQLFRLSLKPKTPCYALSLFTFSFLIGCTATGPADDGWETSEGFSGGAGLFSKEEGSYKISFNKESDSEEIKEADTKSESPSADHIDSITEIASTSEVVSPQEAETRDQNLNSEYESFLRWRQAKSDNSEAYQQFLKWLEYENYRAWKNAQ